MGSKGSLPISPRPSVLLLLDKLYGCRTPSGETAPADGWSGSVGAGGAADDYAVDTCSTSGALVAALGDATGHHVNVDRATWAFEAPSFAKEVGATLLRAGYLHGVSGEKGTYQAWIAGPTATEVFDECVFSLGCQVIGEPSVPTSPANRVVVPLSNLGSHLFANVSCGGGTAGSECHGGFSDPNHYAAVLYLFATDITLEQSAGPTASGVSGELATAPTVAGTTDLAFSSSDPGSGVYEAVFSVDGSVVQRTVLDSNGGRCRDAGGTADGSAAFLYARPCLASVSADVGLDTTAIANGSHHLVVSVLDAAGNSAPVLDRNIVVDNPTPPAAGGAGAGSGATGATTSGAGGTGAPNGSNASAQATLTAAWNGTHSTRLVTGYGRTEVVTGRVTGPGGTPIGGAQIDVTSTPAAVGAHPSALAAPHTRPNGVFTLRIRPGASSRSLTFAYRPNLGDALPVATRTLALAVRAPVTLSVRPAVAEVGETIRFSGRLRGGHLPAGGKLVVLEARSRGGWLKFEVVRSDARGRFSASYRFRFPGPTTYAFRALVETEADYPFAAGTSRSAAVRER